MVCPVDIPIVAIGMGKFEYAKMKFNRILTAKKKLKFKFKFKFKFE